MDDELMRCPVCGTPRASRYAAYCHVCGSPLPELPPEPDERVDATQAPQGWEDPGAYPAGTGPVSQAYSAAGQAPGQAFPPGAQTQPGSSGAGGVRVYDRPETPPSVVRRRRLTWILAGVGVLISLLLLVFGPLRTVLGARSRPDWTPPGTPTPVNVIIPTLPPGVSAAQATARARYTPTFTPTSTPEVAPTVTAPEATAEGGATGEGALPTVVLPTLGPPPTTTAAPTATAVPPASTAALPATATIPPTATAAASIGTPTLSPSAPATSAVTGTIPGVDLPSAISGGRVIAFVSDRSGSPQIWLVGSGGGNQLQVTTQGQNTSPSWSYDDRYLYYLGTRGGQTAVYRLDITTGREEQVLQDPSVISARPLPDGQLAVLRTEDGRYALFVGDRRIFQLDRSFQFQFSPDGRRVVIDPNSDPRVISVVDVSTTRAQDVAPARSWNAGWGQGDRLTYVSDRTGIASVYVAGANGQEPRALSPGDKWSQAPAFSSDGSQIAFIAGDGPAWNLYAVAASGGSAHMVGGPANPSKSPEWQPGGSLIAFESDRSGNWDIYVTDPSGNEAALVNDPGNDVDPAWTW
ncbi:MAG: TolB family protein [Nitrososphaerales archaeon]